MDAGIGAVAGLASVGDFSSSQASFSGSSDDFFSNPREAGRPVWPVWACWNGCPFLELAAAVGANDGIEANSAAVEALSMNWMCEEMARYQSYAMSALGVSNSRSLPSPPPIIMLILRLCFVGPADYDIIIQEEEQEKNAGSGVFS